MSAQRRHPPAEQILVDAPTGTKSSAFDAIRLAGARNHAAGTSFQPAELPLVDFSFIEDRSAIEFVAANSRWRVRLDTYSRLDLPAVSELRRTKDLPLAAGLERADAAAFTTLGWCAPEMLVSKGRDWRTDSWGLLFRPSNFDPGKK